MIKKDVMHSFRREFKEIAVGQVFYYLGEPYIRTEFDSVQLDTGISVQIKSDTEVLLPNRCTLTFENIGDDEYGY